MDKGRLITKGAIIEYWRINTDSKAREDIQTCDLWYKFGGV
jgi:hypothetical protein